MSTLSERIAARIQARTVVQPPTQLRLASKTNVDALKETTTLGFKSDGSGFYRSATAKVAAGIWKMEGSPVAGYSLYRVSQECPPEDPECEAPPAPVTARRTASRTAGEVPAVWDADDTTYRCPKCDRALHWWKDDLDGGSCECGQDLSNPEYRQASATPESKADAAERESQGLTIAPPGSEDLKVAMSVKRAAYLRHIAVNLVTAGALAVDAVSKATPVILDRITRKAERRPMDRSISSWAGLAHLGGEKNAVHARRAFTAGVLGRVFAAQHNVPTILGVRLASILAGQPVKTAATMVAALRGDVNARRATAAFPPVLLKEAIRLWNLNAENRIQIGMPATAARVAEVLAEKQWHDCLHCNAEYSASRSGTNWKCAWCQGSFSDKQAQALYDEMYAPGDSLGGPPGGAPGGFDPVTDCPSCGAHAVNPDDATVDEGACTQCGFRVKYDDNGNVVEAKTAQDWGGPEDMPGQSPMAGEDCPACGKPDVFPSKGGYRCDSCMEEFAEHDPSSGELVPRAASFAVRKAVDESAKKYWTTYFGSYGDTWVAEVKRRLTADLCADVLKRRAVDDDAAKYYSEYFGAYGDELVEEKDRAVTKRKEGQLQAPATPAPTPADAAPVTAQEEPENTGFNDFGEPTFPADRPRARGNDDGGYSCSKCGENLPDEVLPGRVCPGCQGAFSLPPDTAYPRKGMAAKKVNRFAGKKILLQERTASVRIALAEGSSAQSRILIVSRKGAAAERVYPTPAEGMTAFGVAVRQHIGLWHPSSSSTSSHP